MPDIEKFLLYFIAASIVFTLFAVGGHFFAGEVASCIVVVLCWLDFDTPQRVRKQRRKHMKWRPEHTDARDVLYAQGQVATVLARSDLSSMFPPPFDQGQLGSCTGNGWAGVLAFLHRKLYNDGTLWSRLMIYYGERSLEGTVSQDAGALIRDGAKFLAKYGVCAETLWPYIVSKFKLKPPAACWNAATPARITSYMRITSLNGILACLSEGYPIVFGMTVYESFESDAVARTGFVPFPDTAKEQNVGGHCMVIVGHDNVKQLLKVRNSWGTAWGDAGYCYLPYSIFTAPPGLVDDMWTVRK